MSIGENAYPSAQKQREVCSPSVCDRPQTPVRRVPVQALMKEGTKRIKQAVPRSRRPRNNCGSYQFQKPGLDMGVGLQVAFLRSAFCSRQNSVSVHVTNASKNVLPKLHLLQITK